MQNHYITEWRKWRRMKKIELAEKLNLSCTTLYRIETGRQECNLEFLRACAEALTCTPAALVGWPPGDAHALHSICATLQGEELKRALRVLRALQTAPEDGDNPPHTPDIGDGEEDC
jgi:DNA-binding XRE family transcriptional regulator